MERFDEKFDGSGLHGLNTHGDVAMRGDKDNGNADVGLVQLMLKIESADSGQSDIENEATGRFWSVSSEKFQGRSKLSGRQPDRS